MAASSNILDELPWLTPSPRKTRKAAVVRHARSALLLGALGAPLLLANDFEWSSGSKAPAPAAAATPAVIADPFAPKALRPLSPEAAAKWNSAVPEASAVAAATPFAVGSANAQSLARSLQCMTAAIYYEAGNEPVDGQRAVAQVILNRMRSPVYPHSVCGVVYQGSERKTGCQFTFTCDGALARVPSATGWARASAVAAAALGGYVYAPVGWATHYHADYVVPYWAQNLDKLSTIGRHIFYGWKGRSGTRAAFTSGYAGIEPDVAPGGAFALQDAVVPATTEPVRGIVQVTSAERPLIAYGAPAAAPAAETKSASMGAPHPSAGSGARWVIGASTGTARYGLRSTLAATPPQAEAASEPGIAAAPAKSGTIQ
jgi:spore germination cell wall hydrolase CwlJ-like protein